MKIQVQISWVGQTTSLGLTSMTCHCRYVSFMFSKTRVQQIDRNHDIIDRDWEILPGLKESIASSSALFSALFSIFPENGMQFPLPTGSLDILWRWWTSDMRLMGWKLKSSRSMMYLSQLWVSRQERRHETCVTRADNFFSFSSYLIAYLIFD